MISFPFSFLRVTSPHGHGTRYAQHTNYVFSVSSGARSGVSRAKNAVCAARAAEACCRSAGWGADGAESQSLGALT